MDTPLTIADSDTLFADCPVPARIFEFRGQVKRVLDGDTVVVWLDMGDGRAMATKLRMEHVNCPELSAEGGQSAAHFTRELTLGRWCLVQTRMRREQNGRLLGSLYLWNGKSVAPTDVAAEIIKANHGVARS